MLSREGGLISWLKTGEGWIQSEDWQILIREENYWRQRAKMEWAKEVDSNTKLLMKLQTGEGRGTWLRSWSHCWESWCNWAGLDLNLWETLKLFHRNGVISLIEGLKVDGKSRENTSTIWRWHTVFYLRQRAGLNQFIIYSWHFLQAFYFKGE